MTMGERPNRFDPQVMGDHYHFGINFHSTNTLQKKRFQDYFNMYGRGLEMVCSKISHLKFKMYSTELVRIVQQGIPLEFKASLWFVFSGAASMALTCSKDYYLGLCKKQEENRSNIKSIERSVANVMDQIEKDLHRSLPDQLYYQKGGLHSVSVDLIIPGEGIIALRNVLGAYALHNPQV